MATLTRVAGQEITRLGPAVHVPPVTSCCVAMGMALVILVCGGCGDRTRPGSASFRASAADPVQDYTKPYLTDEKMHKFIRSMKEDKNPFEIVFKKNGGMQNLLQMQSRVAEFNSFAQKYGFRDYQDYTAVWGRILIAQMQIFAQDSMKDAVAMTQKNIQDATEQLQRPGITPQVRKEYESQIESGKQSLAQLTKPPSQLNDTDFALVQKYKTQIDEAAKKYQGS